VNDLTNVADIDFSSFPDKKGHFGIYGGRFVSETLISALDDL
jgi:tryptophan synthase beta chain